MKQLLKRYSPYTHHILYLLVVAPVWLYGLSRYDGPSPYRPTGNGGPLAYSPWLDMITYALMVYAAISLLMVAVSIYMLARHRSKPAVVALLTNICLPVILLIVSFFMWAFLEEA